MGTVPYYLQPTVTTTQKDSAVDIGKALEFSYDYDYGYMPEPQGTKSFWDSLAEVPEDVGNYATYLGGGYKNLATNVYEGAKDTVKSVTTGINETVGGLFDSVLMRVVLIFAIMVGGIWLLAKAGVIKDVASVFRP